MRKSSSMSAYEIRMEGWKALTDRLGPAGAMRFMMQYDRGTATTRRRDRKIFADLDIDELIAAVRRQKSEPSDDNR